jgi:RecJ-like exonuclease
MVDDPCRICGGDGRITNSFAQSTARCPSCHGTGRRVEDTGFHDVTKTKPSHHRGTAGAIQTNRANQPVVKQTWPVTIAGGEMAAQIRDSAGLNEETKSRLIREIMDHEATHGQCTQTFLKKLRKQFRPSTK